MDPEIQEVVELLFSRRLETFRHAIEAETNGATRDDPSAMARGARLGACSELFRGHCVRVLRDYVALLELFDALALPDGLGSSFEAYVDATASVLLATLDATGQAERNRVSNQAASIKSETGADLREEIERAQRSQEQNAKGASAANELDDRLPLGRRGAFDRDLARAVDEAERNREPFALVMIDIDHFKKVNDQFGHLAGDYVLRKLAGTVQKMVRREELLARYGGEEFGVVLSETDIEKAARFGEKIRSTIERTKFTFDSRTIKVTASIGVSTLKASMSRESFVHAADQALYQAKQKGRNRLVRSDSRGQPS